MKKIFAAVLAVCFVLFSAVACKTEDVIRLSEVTHSVFYAPQYVAIALGYFEDEGLNVKLTDAGGANNVMTSLVSKSADIGLCGPEAAIYVYLEGKADHAVIFGQMTKRDGSFLLGRQPDDTFDVSKLVGKEIIAGRRGGVPAMTLQYMLEQNGLTVSTTGKGAGHVYLNFDIEFNYNASAFAGGTGDYVALFEPTASKLVSENKGNIVASVGALAGAVPYTAYTCLKSYYNKNEEKLTKLLRAVDKGLAYINTHTAEEVAQLIKGQFAASTVEMLAAAIENYKNIEAWNSTPVMSEADFNKLQDIMENAGELTARAPYASLVYNGYASGIK